MTDPIYPSPALRLAPLPSTYSPAFATLPSTYSPVFATLPSTSLLWLRCPAPLRPLPFPPLPTPLPSNPLDPECVMHAYTFFYSLDFPLLWCPAHHPAHHVHHDPNGTSPRLHCTHITHITHVTHITLASLHRRWTKGALEEGSEGACGLVRLSSLEPTYRALEANTLRHCEGLPADHVLLAGPSGSGKSSLLWEGTLAAGGEGREGSPCWWHV